MRVLTIVPYIRGVAPGQRSSIEMWEPVLREAGIELVWVEFETPELQALLHHRGRSGAKLQALSRAYLQTVRRVRSELGGVDAAFVYREAALVGPAVIERLVARRVPVVYQLDDPLFVPYRSPFNGYLSYLKFFGKVKAICRLSRTVIVNSSPIRGFAEQHNGNVWQIPSLVDDRYTFEPPPRRDRVCVGWSGSPTTARNLALVAEPLRRLQQRCDVDVHLIGSTAFDLPGLRYTSQPWSALTEVDDLRRLDVGLVPVPDNPWNHWKFFMKIAQYMGVGVPPVATPIGSAPEDIQHGVNGYLATTPDEWLASLERLVTDHDLRHTMAVQAAAAARERYSVTANAPKIVEAFRSAVA